MLLTMLFTKICIVSYLFLVYVNNANCYNETQKTCESVLIDSHFPDQSFKECHTIEGNLTIREIDLTVLKESLSFPRLIVIYGFLRISNIRGTHDLSQIFPNLALINGENLIENKYSILIQNTSLKFLNISSLRTVQRGDINLSNNTELCYVDTVDWKNIFQQPYQQIQSIGSGSFCQENCNEECRQGSVLFCWAHDTCHSVKETKCTTLIITRNIDPKTLVELNKCEIIDGDLVINSVNLSLISKNSSYQLSRLRVINGRLLVFKLSGLHNLGQLLPNIAIIRGFNLMMDYSVVIRETSLKSLNLKSLRVIQNGGIAVSNNPELCYLKTVNWSLIVRQSQHQHFFSDNKITCPSFCPEKCRLSSDSSLCWTHNTCQFVCHESCMSRNLECHINNPSFCCDEKCYGSCFGPGKALCVACRNFRAKLTCIDECPNGSIALAYRCVEPKYCTSLNKFIDNNKCIDSCPTNSLPVEISNIYYCQSCNGTCPTPRNQRDCNIVINYLSDLPSLDSCISVSRFALSILDQSFNATKIITEALDNFFKQVKEIGSSFKIQYCEDLTDLQFMRHLIRIGKYADSARDFATLMISDNPRLTSMWKDEPEEIDENLELYGEFMVHYNDHLCPRDILTMFNSGRISFNSSNPLKQTQIDMIKNFNGLKGNCSELKINLKISAVNWTSAQFSWGLDSLWRTEIDDDLSDYEEHSFLLTSTIVYVKKVAGASNLTKITEICSSEGSLLSTMVLCQFPLNSSDPYPCSYKWNNLEPGTKYGIYVDMKMSLKVTTDALSRIFYFTTISINPKPVPALSIQSLDSSSLRISWISPSSTLVNDSVMDLHYLLWIKPIVTQDYDIELIDYCQDSSLLWKQNYKSHYITNYFNTQAKKDNSKFCEKLAFDCSVFTFNDEYGQKFEISNRPRVLNNWPSGSSVWMVDAYDESLPIILSESLESRKFRYPHLTKNISNRISTLIIASNKDYQQNNEEFNWIEIQNLHHFTRYVIEIQICQRVHVSDFRPPWYDLDTKSFIKPDKEKWRIYDQSFCSSRTINHQITKELITANKLNNEKVSFTIKRNLAIFLWPDIVDSNGPIAFYEARFCKIGESGLFLQDKNHSSYNVFQINSKISQEVYNNSSTFPIIWNRICLNRFEWERVGRQIKELAFSPKDEKSSNSQDWSSFSELFISNSTIGGIRVNDIDQGLYLIQFVAYSIGSNGTWSEPIIFQITESRLIVAAKNQLIITVAILLLLAFFICITVKCILYLRRRWIMTGRDLAPNPEYWAIYEVDKWEIDLLDVDCLGWKHILGQGSYGMVYQGVLKRLKTPAAKHFIKTTNIPIAIKTLNSTATLFDRRDFINEACIMKQFQSFHLIGLLGVVTKSNLKTGSNYISISIPKTRKRFESLNKLLSGKFSFISRTIRTRFKSSNLKSAKDNDLLNSTYQIDVVPAVSRNKWNALDAFSSEMEKIRNAKETTGPLVIMELMSQGDLASYLRHLGDTGDGSVHPAQAYLWATQITDGMAYLSSRKYVHRDLAARNCLVNSNLTVKIGDFGLCRDIYEQNYYHKLGRARLPVRWMAPESLYSAYFTTQSDVWSYGVVLWEIATMACLPYRGLSHEEVVKFVLKGNNLLTENPPTNCPALLLALMMHCFSYSPNRRPTFKGLLSILAPRFSDQRFRTNSYYFMECNKGSTEQLRSVSTTHSQPISSNKNMQPSIKDVTVPFFDTFNESKGFDDNIETCGRITEDDNKKTEDNDETRNLTETKASILAAALNEVLLNKLSSEFTSNLISKNSTSLNFESKSCFNETDKNLCPNNDSVLTNIKKLLWLGTQAEDFFNEDLVNSGLPDKDTDFTDPLTQPVVLNEVAFHNSRIQTDSSSTESLYSIDPLVFGSQKNKKKKFD